MWKEKILKAVGENGQVLINVIPEIKEIIGNQPEVIELPPSESQNRFNMVFQNFVKIFAKEEHPLVIFIDDLQWADSASINLMKILLLDEDLRYILFLGAYRDNEVDSTHQLTELIQNIRKENISEETIKVTPLTVESVSELVSDTLKLSKSDSNDLASVINDKTGGNPFFVNEFLKTLHDKELIKFDNGWKIDLVSIKQSGITANVVELMAEKIKKLKEDTLNIIKIACCVGVKFYVDTISVVCEKNETEIMALLKDAFNEGFIIKSENDLRFVHDKVREATYSLIDEKEAKKLHYKIGKALISNPESQKHEERIFSIVNQMNLCKDLLNMEEKKMLVELNILAGRKAKLSNAYDASVDFLRNGSSLLPDDCWKSMYKLALEIKSELAESEYLALHSSEAELLFKEILSNAKDLMDKSKIYILQIRYYATKDTAQAIKIGVDACKEFGLKMPLNPGQLSSVPMLLGVMMKLKKMDTKVILNLPVNKDEKILALCDILGNLIAPVFISRPNLVAYIILNIIQLSLKYGNTPNTSFSYIIYAIFILAFGKIDESVRFGKLGVDLSDKFNNLSFKSKSRFSQWAVLYNITHPKEFYENFAVRLQYSINAGDLEFTGYNYVYMFISHIIAGKNLSEIEEWAEKYAPICHKLKQETITDWFNICREGLNNLVTNKENKTALVGDYCNEDITLNSETHKNVSNTLFYYSLIKVYVNYIYCSYEKNLPLISKVEKFALTFVGQFFFTSENLIFALSYSASYDKAAEKDKSIYVKKIKGYMSKFKIYSEKCKDANLHKYQLIQAEYARITGNDKDAMRLYDEAIMNAKLSEITQEEAIANECAAKYYLSKGFIKIASAYMMEARFGFSKWGCTPKVEQMDKMYPQLLSSIAMNNSTGNITGATISATRKATTKMSTAGNSGSSFLDVGTVLKATQTMSSEIEMEKLLSKMIKILIENAGAEKGALILSSNDGKLTIEAEAAASSNEVTVLKSIAVDDSKKLSAAIVRYVAKTSEIVILDDAVNSGTFKKEQYIIDNKVKSVICTPIVNQGKVVAILYLENNLSTAAFTPARVETLNVLSSQAAISIENARLIDGMKEKARLQQEMAIAEKIQTSLCPAAPEHDELEITAVMRPAEEVGGDYYDVVTDKDKNTWFAIGDVSGHGVTPGLVMMMAETGFNVVVEGKSTLTPAEAIVEVNRILNKNVRQRLKESHFMTMSFLKYTGNGKFAYAGSHLDIVVWRAAAKKCELFKTEGIFLSIIPDITPMTQNFDITLNSGDIMVLYTDGVIESRFKGDRTKLWGMEGLCEAVENSASGGVEAVKDAVVKGALDWCDQKPDDDITMIVIKKK